MIKGKIISFYFSLLEKSPAVVQVYVAFFFKLGMYERQRIHFLQLKIGKVCFYFSIKAFSSAFLKRLMGLQWWDSHRFKSRPGDT